MLTTEVIPELVEGWKRIFEANRLSLHPNRKTGKEIDDYFRKKYHYQTFDNEEFRKIVAYNIMENEHSRRKLPQGTRPNPQCYCKDGVLVGIDLLSGEFHVECEDINKAAAVYDDLFLYRGLDEEDLKNYFLVAEYIRLSEVLPLQKS